MPVAGFNENIGRQHYLLARSARSRRSFFCPLITCLKQSKHSGDLRIHFRTHVRHLFMIRQVKSHLLAHSAPSNSLKRPSFTNTSKRLQIARITPVLTKNAALSFKQNASSLNTLNPTHPLTMTPGIT